MTRSLRLPSPLEQIPCVLRPEILTPPFDWADIFGRTTPVELELGSGRGLYLSGAGLQYPDRSFIGVERAGKYFRHAVLRVERAGLANVRLVRADAFDLLERWIPAGSVEVVHVYFPDPWPKRRHARRRLLQPELFTGIHRALGPGGTFCFASDVRDYFVSAVRDVVRLGLFEQVDWPVDAPDRLPTSYALKYQREGRALGYAKFRRVEGPEGPGRATGTRMDPPASA